MKSDSINKLISSIDDINNLKELTINRFDIVGDIQEVDLSDLEKLPNLESLTLINLNINASDMKYITSLSCLKELSLINCEIDNIGDYSFNVDRLTVDNTYVNDNIFKKYYELLVIKNMQLNNVCHANILDIRFVKTDLEKIDFTNINTIIISEKQYNDQKEIVDLLKAEKNIIVKNGYDEEIKI